MKPRQPACVRKVLSPEDETHLSPGESLGDFFEQGGDCEKNNKTIFDLFDLRDYNVFTCFV